MNFKIRSKGLTGLLFSLTVLFSMSCGTKHKKTSVSLFSSGSGKFSESDFSAKLGELYKFDNPADTVLDKKSRYNVHELMRRTYHSYDFLPLWLNENGNTDAAESLLKELDDMQNDGINPERYHVSALKRSLEAFRQAKSVDLNTLLSLDTALTKNYIQASRDLLLGVVNPQKADSLWFHANDSDWHPELVLATNLYGKEKYPSLDSFRSNMPTYELLLKARKHYTELVNDSNLINAKKALLNNKALADSLIPVIVKAELPHKVGTDDTTPEAHLQILNSFRDYYGIKTTGKIDSTTFKYLTRMPDSVLPAIDVNLERVRWMRKDIEPLYIIVDVPLFELYLHADGRDAMHMRVVVGKTVRQTPSLNANMANIVFNPPWGVPPTIMKQDVLPGMQKSGKAYLTKKDLKVYDRKGHEVNASNVNASNYKQFVFRQPPGDDNALGYVKFNLPNKFDIYLHDTPHRDLFDKNDRAQSSGCVRLQQPKEMALYILTELEKRNFRQGTMDSIIRTQKTKYEILKNKIPVHIVYLTAYDDDMHQHIRFVRDVYKRDRKLADLLEGIN